MGFLAIQPRILKRYLLAPPLLMILFATGGCRHHSWPLWDAYSTRFINAQGCVFDPQGNHVTSEGEAYALFFSLVDNKRDTFDHILTWTQTNLAGGDLHLHLPAWLWGKDKDGQWKTLDTNPASDADVWMAYTLIEAGRLWKYPPYDQLGRAMLALIAKNEVANLPGFGPMLLPGPQGFQHGNTWTLNPSYVPLFLFDRLGEVDPFGPWVQIAARIPTLLEQSNRHGYAMDWVDYVPGDGFYPAVIGQQNPADPNTAGPVGSYDAIRVYLWAGMLDKENPSRTRILNAIPAMAAYLAEHGASPEKVSEKGIPLAQDGPVGFSAALVPYLRAYPGFSRSAARQWIRIARQRNATGLYGKDLAYYDQNLALFGTGFAERRFRFGRGGELNVEWKLQ